MVLPGRGGDRAAAEAFDEQASLESGARMDASALEAAQSPHGEPLLDRLSRSVHEESGAGGRVSDG